jgi:hypothetical protein
MEPRDIQAERIMVLFTEPDMDDFFDCFRDIESLEEPDEEDPWADLDI